MIDRLVEGDLGSLFLTVALLAALFSRNLFCQLAVM